MTVCPTRLEPTFSLRPWGSLSLAPFFPEKAKLSEPIGEAWFTGNESVCANGPFAGLKLGQAWPRMNEAWRGDGGLVRSAWKTFPLLAKFIFSEDKLSVQVHPDDDYAAKHEPHAGGIGKTEMWYAVSARPGAEVLAGLKPGVSSESFRRSIADGTAEDCLEHLPLAAGEAIFVPARTAHTIGAGLVLCEIQQHSDLTYRVFDYNRRDAQGRTRELHIEKAMEVMRFGGPGCGKLAPVSVEHHGARVTLFVASRYFVAEKWEFKDSIERSTTSEHFDLFIVLDGGGEIEAGQCRLTYRRAQAWLVPAALGAYRLRPSSDTSLLRTFVPADNVALENYFSDYRIGRQAAERLVRA